MLIKSASKLWVWLEKVNTVRFIIVSSLIAVMATAIALTIVWVVTEPTRY